MNALGSLFFAFALLAILFSLSVHKIEEGLFENI
jgi:hypothetical protein